MPAAAGSGEVGEAAVPVAVLEQQAGSGADVDLGERVRPWRRCRRRSSRDGAAADRGHGGRGRRTRRSPGPRPSRDDLAERDRRRVEQDERRRPDPGRRQARPTTIAPQQCADDLEVGRRRGRRPDARGEVGGVVAERDAPGPVAGLPVPRQVHRDDPSPGRGQRRPDAPPDLGGRRDAVDQQERPVRRRRPRSARRTGCRRRPSSRASPGCGHRASASATVGREARHRGRTLARRSRAGRIAGPSRSGGPHGQPVRRPAQERARRHGDPGRGARGARRRPARHRRRQHRRLRPRDHDDRRRRRRPRRSSTRRATSTSRASRS